MASLANTASQSRPTARWPRRESIRAEQGHRFIWSDVVVWPGIEPRQMALSLGRKYAGLLGPDYEEDPERQSNQEAGELGRPWDRHVEDGHDHDHETDQTDDGRSPKGQS